MTDPAQAERDFDSTVLRLLLDVNVPWSVEEIVRELQDSDARDSVARLTSAGLVNRTGELVFPARAARRAAELEIAD
jgi:predicted transcriptional regulator